MRFSRHIPSFSVFFFFYSLTGVDLHLPRLGLINMIRNILFIVLLCGLCAGCLPSPYYQQQVPIPQNQWNYNFRPMFKFDITDTAAHYQPYFIIQHTQAYPYNNLWMWMYIKMPGDSLGKKERINISLAGPDGAWKGRGMGAIYEERVYLDLGDSVKFRRAGHYEIVLEQNMRVNPLPEVLHVGMRIDKVKPENIRRQ